MSIQFNELKEKQSVKISVKFQDQERNIKGIIYKIDQDYIYLISDTKQNQADRETYSSHHKLTISRKNVISIEATRLPKEVSDALKVFFNKIKQIEDTMNKIKELEGFKRELYKDVNVLEDEFAVIKFNRSDEPIDIKNKFEKDIASVGSSSNRDFRNITVNNIKVEGKNIKLSLDINDMRRGIVTITSRNGHSDFDMYDWEDIAKEHAPKYDALIQREFSFAKNIKISRDANPAEKGYVSLSSIYEITLQINKENYEEILGKFKNSIQNVIKAYL